MSASRSELSLTLIICESCDFFFIDFLFVFLSAILRSCENFMVDNWLQIESLLTANNYHKVVLSI